MKRRLDYKPFKPGVFLKPLSHWIPGTLVKLDLFHYKSGFFIFIGPYRENDKGFDDLAILFCCKTSQTMCIHASFMREPK